MKLCFATICIISVVFSPICASPTNRTKISILIQTAHESFQDVATKVQHAVDKILDDSLDVSNNSSNELEVQLVDAGHYDGVPNRLYITRDIVCARLLNGSVAVLFYHHEPDADTEVSSTAAYALGFYHIPTIGIGLRDAEFSRKTVYPTFMRTSPAHSNVAHVVLRLLTKLAYRQVVIVHVKGDANALDFVNVFEENRQRFEIHVQKYIELELNSLMNGTIDEYFEEVTSNIIILFARKDDARKIFEDVRILSMPGKVCIVNELATSIPNLPTGCLSMRLRLSPLRALRDALLVVRHGFGFLSDREVQPPQLCENVPASSEWINGFGIQFYKHLVSSVVYDDNKIEFNDEGERINVAYDVINHVEGKFHVVGHMSSQNVMELDEAQIVWLGNSTKPAEITLPKHLRAVTVADAPFVYAVPVPYLERCHELGTLTVDDIEVAGPWYDCPKRINDSFIEKYCCSGYAIDLLSNLSLPEINGTIDTAFTFDIHLNDTYGAVLLGDVGYTLGGMVGELDTDLADLAVGALTINPEREQYIDFSEPWLYHGIKILEKWKPRDSSMESFVQPLKTSLWTALFISVLCVGCFIFLLDYYSPFDRFYKVDKNQIREDDPFLERTSDDRVTFGEAFWFVWGVLLNSGVAEKTPRSCSARVLGIIWCGFCMIMVASYTANLAAFLVLDQPEKGLTGVTDPRLRNPSANFSFGTVLDTNTYQYFKRHVELSTMHRNMEAHNVRVAAHAIQALINETLDAFIWDSTRLEFEAARNCELRTRGTLFGRSAYGIGLQKKSPWTPHITSAILRLSENGKLEELYTKWIALNHRRECEPEAQKSPARLGLTNMRDVFILVTGGILVGVGLSFIEVYYGRRKTEQSKQRDVALRFGRKWRALSRNPRTLRIQNVSLNDGTLKKSPNLVRESGASIQKKLAKTNLNFGRESSLVYCSRCRNLVKTQPFPTVGMFAYTWVAIFVVLFMWPCAPLPCFLACFADYVHICPVCGHKIGRYKRGCKPRFYA